MDDLTAVERRLRAIIGPYEGRLETATIYGIPALRRPGAKGHDWFAFVKPASRHVSLFLLPVHTWPDLLESISPALRKRQTGKTTFGFRAIDEAEMAELERLVARAFEAYIAASPSLCVKDGWQVEAGGEPEGRRLPDTGSGSPGDPASPR